MSERTELVTQHHFFISTVVGWITADNMIQAIREAAHLGEREYVAIWRVPLPQKSAYRIENFGPQVEGAELIYLDNGGERNHPETEQYLAIATQRGGKTMSNAEGE